MSKQDLIEVLKGAILLEMNGERFYRTAMEKSSNLNSRELFSMLADDEKSHREILEETFRTLVRGEEINLPDKVENVDFSGPVIGEEFKKALKETDYDFTAISIALTLEEKAFKYYQEQADKVTSQELKELFEWLYRWELAHHKYFSELEKEIRLQVWNDSNFWPY